MFRCFQTAKGAILLAVVTVVALYLIVWHGAHLAGLAPFVLVAACPLMHIFGHGGHGSRRHAAAGHDHSAPRAEDAQATASPEPAIAGRHSG